MRSILLVLLPVLFIAKSPAQILLQSGFENWTAGLPNGFVGPRTTFPLDSLSQTSVEVHGGTRAMYLGLGEEASGQVTTAPLIVTAWRLYEVRFWVRGTGRIATGLYDGRASNEGYAPLNTPLEVNSNTWQYVIQTVLSQNATTVAEFLLDVAETIPGSFLVIDDLTINASTLPDAMPATISEIQTTTHWTGSSPLNFAFVRTEGIVTAIAPNSVFMQDGAGAWSGIEVRYTAPATWAPGHRLLILASVSELSGIEDTWSSTRTQLINVQHLEVVSIGEALPEAALVSADAIEDEPWESVLVTVQDLECVSLPDPETNDWTATNWQGTVIVDDLFYLHTPDLGVYYTITGIANYRGTMVLEPRSADDFTAGVGLVEYTHSTAHVWPNPATDVLNIQTSSAVNARYIVMDATGRQVLHGLVTNGLSTIDVSTLNAGAYVLWMAHMGTTRFVVR